MLDSESSTFDLTAHAAFKGHVLKYQAVKLNTVWALRKAHSSIFSAEYMVLNLWQLRKWLRRAEKWG